MSDSAKPKKEEKMEKLEVPLSWIKYEVDFCRRLTDGSHSPGHFNALIKVTGLNNVLRFIDREYLEKNRVNLSLPEEVNDFIILENE
ncbi:MAG: hypothetical protein D4R39_03305 [Methylophilaceae bacterium]|nr:MAG: hypothetical protein D4R39_03305 [Methylophilaceae bacterium]